MTDRVRVHDDPAARPGDYRDLALPRGFHIVAPWRRSVRAGLIASAAMLLGFGTYGALAGLALLALAGLGAGALFGYAALCAVVDRTVLDVSAGVVAVRRRPLPFGRPVVADVVDIATVVAERDPTRGPMPGGFRVRAVLRDGASVVLVDDLDDEDDAQHVRRTLVTQLGLDD